MELSESCFWLPTYRKIRPNKIQKTTSNSQPLINSFLFKYIILLFTPSFELPCMSTRDYFHKCELPFSSEHIQILHYVVGTYAVQRHDNVPQITKRIQQHRIYCIHSQHNNPHFGPTGIEIGPIPTSTAQIQNLNRSRESNETTTLSRESKVVVTLSLLLRRSTLSRRFGYLTLFAKLFI